MVRLLAPVVLLLAPVVLLLELGHWLLELSLQLLELSLQLFKPAIAPTFSSHGGVDRVICIGEVCSVSGAETRYWTTDVGRG